MTREHWLVCPHIEPGGMDWMLAVGTGSPLNWKIGSGRSTRKKWAGEALRAAVLQGVGIDVTISDGDPLKLMADPDYLTANSGLSLVCREYRNDRARWVLLNMNGNGEFTVGRVVVGAGIERLFDELITASGGHASEACAIWLRSDWCATDILQQAKAA